MAVPFPKGPLSPLATTASVPAKQLLITLSTSFVCMVLLTIPPFKPKGFILQPLAAVTLLQSRVNIVEHFGWADLAPFRSLTLRRGTELTENPMTKCAPLCRPTGCRVWSPASERWDHWESHSDLAFLHLWIRLLARFRLTHESSEPYAAEPRRFKSFDAGIHVRSCTVTVWLASFPTFSRHFTYN